MSSSTSKLRVLPLEPAINTGCQLRSSGCHNENGGTQTFRPIVSSHHFLVRRFAPNSYLGKTFYPFLINREDVSPPVFIVQEDVSHPNHTSEKCFAPKPYFRKIFSTQTIFKKDVSHPNHISERRFAQKSYLGKTFRTHFIIRKDVLPPLHILKRRLAP